MKWLNQIPLLRLIIPFALGIMLSFYFPRPIDIYQLSIIGITSFIFIAFFTISKIHQSFTHRFLFGIMVSLLFVIVGYEFSNSRIERFQQNHYSQITTQGTSRYYQAVVISEPEEKANSIKVILKITGFKKANSWTPSIGKVLTYFEKDSTTQLKYGDVLFFSNTPSPVPPPANFDEFDYKKYLSHNYIYDRLYLKSSDYQIIDFKPDSYVKEISIGWRQFLLNRYALFGIEGSELSILSALTLGKKESLSNDLKSAYASAGAMHVLAVSGLHVGIIFLVLRFLLGWLDRFKYGSIIKAISLLIAIWIYAFLTGLSPSVIRASTMFSFMILATSFKKSSNIYNTLALSAFAILLYEPFMVLEVGFQLSYLAVIGIIYIHPHLYGLFSFQTWIIDKAWEITCVSISAQIITAPLGILYFHQFPTYFLFSNLIVIPAAFAIIFLAIGFQTLSFIPVIGDIIAFVLKWFVFGLNYCVQWIEKLPNSLISGLDITIYETWLLYGLISFSSVWLIYYKNRFLIISLFVVLLLTTNQTIEKWNQLQQSEIVFYNTGKEPLIEFIQGTQKYWLADSTLIHNKERMQFNVFHHDWVRGINTKTTNTAPVKASKNASFFGRIRVLQITPEMPFSKELMVDLNPDIIYINTYKKLTTDEISTHFKDQKIILGPACSRKVIAHIENICDSLNYECYNIKELGSLKLSLNHELSEINSITYQKPR